MLPPHKGDHCYVFVIPHEKPPPSMLSWATWFNGPLSGIHVYRGPMHPRTFTLDDKAVGQVYKAVTQVDKAVKRVEKAVRRVEKAVRRVDKSVGRVDKAVVQVNKAVG